MSESAELYEFVALLVIAALAFVVPFLSTRIKLPVVVGEIVMGILVGLIAHLVLHFYGVDLFPDEYFEGETSPIGFLALMGFVFLMFLTGLEVNFDKLEEVGIRPILTGISLFIITLSITVGFILLLNVFWEIPLIFALVLSTTSVGIVVPTVRELGLLKTKIGQDILIYSLVIDIATMVLLPVFVVADRLHLGHLSADPLELLAVLLIPLIFLMFFVIARLGNLLIWNYPDTMAQFFKSDDSSEVGVRVSLMVMLIFVALSTFVGAEAILGAFLAGAMMSMIFRQNAILEKKLFGIGYGFLIPIFFITVGITFDFSVFMKLTALILVPLLIFVAFANKLIPAMILPGMDKDQKLTVGFLISSRLSLAIAAAHIGRQSEILDSTLESSIIILAVVTCILSPILFRHYFNRLRHGFNSC